MPPKDVDSLKDDVAAVNSSQEQKALPSGVEAGPTTDELDEMNASALPPSFDKTPEIAAFTQ